MQVWIQLTPLVSRTHPTRLRRFSRRPEADPLPLKRFRGTPAIVVLRVDGGAGRHEPIHRGGVASNRRKMQRRPASAVAAPKSRKDLVFSGRGGRQNVERSWFKST